MGMLSQASTLPLGIRYYLLRGTAMIPMVPVDQLPFQLQDIPKQLSHRQMSDEGWKLLQETDQTAAEFPVQVREATAQPSPVHHSFLAPDHHVRENTKISQVTTASHDRSDVQSSLNDRHASHTGVVQDIDDEHSGLVSCKKLSPIAKNSHLLDYRKPCPSGIEPDEAKKEYCTYWIAKGECAFLAVGCRFKHEMPGREKLRELGFNQEPRWWKEKSRISARSPTWMELRLAAGADKEHVRHTQPKCTSGSFCSKSKIVIPPGSSCTTISQKLFDLKNTWTPETEPVNQRSTPPTHKLSDQRESLVQDLLIDLEDAPAQCQEQLPSPVPIATSKPRLLQCERLSSTMKSGTSIATTKEDQKPARKDSGRKVMASAEPSSDKLDQSGVRRVRRYRRGIPVRKH